MIFTELKKDPILIACVIICIVVGTGIVFALQSHHTAAVYQIQANQTVGTPVPPIASTPQTIHPPDSSLSAKITRDEATTRMQEEYPSGMYTIYHINLTDRYSGKTLYEFTMVPAESSIYEKNTTFFVDAETGDLYSLLQENAGITIEQAKLHARQAFPTWTIDRVRIKYVDGTQYIRSWEFYLYHNDKELVHGSLDADSGELSTYAIGVTRMGRSENPSITIDAAQQVADREIEKRNGVIPILLSDSRLDPFGMPGEKIAGRYVFVYNRVIQNIPCDSDGFTIVVDSVAGNVIEYRKSWSLPENAVAASSKPATTKDAAIKTVEQEAAAIYPASTASLKIVSTELRWKDFHNPDKIVPVHESIPLAWKVQFDDESIRAQQWPNPATGWVDAQTGKLLDIYYRH
ncbi:MAG: hypothetical protein PHT99_00465 [Methanoregula sp.]|nr:hypothetical protein [Methanoregula sp.]